MSGIIMPKSKLLFTALFAISAGIFVAITVMAWTNPSANPPGGTSAALNYLNGNIGIGTTGPGQKLTVAGTIESTNGGIKFPDGTTQNTAASGFPSGTQIVFFQALCPSGWTQNVSYNDRMIRIAGTGGGQGGNWTINGISTNSAGDHTHSTPAHNHNIAVVGSETLYSNNPSKVHIVGSQLVTAGGSTQGSLNIAGSYTEISGAGTSGNAGTHSHAISQDGSWRPAYIDAIICQKN